MDRYLALLRGINLGSRKRVLMAELRTLLTGLGHGEVSTYLQSGNALFTSARTDSEELAAEIEQALSRELNVAARCLIRRREDLQRVVDTNPLGDAATDPARLVVTFLNVRPDPALLADIDAEAYLPDRFAPGEQEIYTWHPDGMRDAKLTNVFFEKKLGGKTTDVVGTARNWNTVTKLLALMA